MRDLLFVAHAVAFSSLACGLRAWLRRDRPRVIAAPGPHDEERYRALIRELADLERHRSSGQIEAADYEARRSVLLDEATRLRGA